MRSFILALSWALVLLPLARASAGSELEAQLPESRFPPLRQMLGESIHHSWRMIEARLRVEEARGEERVFSAGRYPSVSGSFRYTGRLEDRDDFENTRSFYQPQAALTVRQPLYHWGALVANDRIGRIRTALAEDNRAEAYRLLVQEIRSSFLEWVVQDEAIALAERQIELVRLQRKAADESFARGEITAEEQARSRVSAETTELRLERLRRERRRMSEDLTELTGVELISEVSESRQTPAEVAWEAPAVSEWEEADSFQPWRELSRGRVRQAREQYQVERVRNRPRVNLIAGVAQDQVAVFDRSDINRTVVFGGIELTWDIFDGFETQGRRSAAVARKRYEEVRHERLQREWTIQKNRLAEAVELAGRELQLLRERLDLSARELSRVENDLERGLVSALDWAAARVEHQESKLAAVRGRTDYFMAVAELLSEAGFDPAMEVFQARVQ